MFVIRTYVAASSIHGLGVFAAEDAAAGQPVWQFEPGLDLVIPPARLDTLPDAFKAFLSIYGYASPDMPAGSVVLSCDNAKYLNHSDDPNCESSGPVNLALRPIKVGDEITCDYRACVAGWAGFD